MKTASVLLKNPKYVLLGTVVSILSFIVFSVAPHIQKLQDISSFDKAQAAGGSVIWKAVQSFLLHTFEPTLIPTIIISLLFGLVITLLVYYYKQKGSMLVKTSGAGTVGMVLGVLGIGCSACGTLALTALLGTVGLGGVVAFLPFGGAEFLYLGIVLMIASIWQLIRLIEKPMVCE